jgi:hypothetical protein
VRRYEEEILPTSSLLIESRRAAYQTSRGGARELLDASRMRLMAESDAAQRRADRYELIARWEAMSGTPLDLEGETK